MANLMTETDSAHLKDLVIRTIEVYNRYRSPETNAKLVSVKKDGFIIDFEGPFCTSFNVREYFEDFIYELENINKELMLEVVQTKSTGPQKFRVRYKMKESFSGVEEDMLFREFLLERGLSFEEFLASNSCTKDVFMFHFRTWLFEKKGAKNRAP